MMVEWECNMYIMSHHWDIVGDIQSSIKGQDYGRIESLSAAGQPWLVLWTKRDWGVCWFMDVHVEVSWNGDTPKSFIWNPFI